VHPTRGPTATIDRLDCVYLVPRDHPDGSAVSFRLDAVARGPLVESVAEALSATLDPADPSVWVIRRLDVRLALRIDAQDLATMARAWAQGIVAHIAAVVRGEVSLPDGDVVRYPDRVAYLVAFAIERIVRRASDRWEFSQFEGFAVLPPGAAVVSAAVAWELPVVSIVTRLAQAGRLQTLLLAATAADSTALWHACRGEGDGVDPQRAEHLVWRHRAAAGRAGGPVPVAALRLLGAVLADTAAADGATVAAAVTRYLARRHASPAPHADTAPGAEDESAGAEAPRTDPVAAGAHTADADAAAPAPRRETAAPVRPLPAPGKAEEYASPHAGVLLLLPSLLDAGLDEGSRAAAADAAGAAALRHRVLLRCLGARTAVAANGDPLLRLVAGMVPDDQPAEDHAGTDPDRLLAALVTALVAHGQCDLATVAVDTLPDPATGTPVALLRAVHEDMWLRLGPGDDPRTRAHALDALAIAGLRPDTLVEGDAAAAGDLHFLGTGVGDPFDLAVTVMARAGIRLFARRLLGFGRATAAHLAVNAYGGGGLVRTRPGSIDVTLDPSPLQVVVTLARMDSLECTVPWLATELVLHAEGRGA
jgi:hypothetical protein